MPITFMHRRDWSLGTRGGKLTRTELERRFRELQREYELHLDKKIRLGYHGYDIYCDTLEEAMTLLRELVK